MAIGFILLGCIQPAAQLAGWLGNRETFGIIEISSQQEFEQAQALQQRVAQLKKPLLTPSLMLRTNDTDLRRAAKEKYSRVGEEMHQHFHYDLYAVNPAGK